MTLNRRAVFLGVTATAGAGLAYGYFGMSRATPASQVLSAPEAYAALQSGDLLLVDVRRPDEWERTGLAKGAVPIDLRRDDFVAAVKAARVDENQPIAMICARGVRSRRMTQRLEEAGMGPILDVSEGMLGSSAGPGWLARALPTVAWSAG